MGIGDDILNTDGYPQGLPGSNPNDLSGVDQLADTTPGVQAHTIEVPASDQPCFTFPHLQLPVFAFPKLTITLPEICCSNTSGPVFLGQSFLSSFRLPGISIGTNYDNGDPRVEIRDGDLGTIVSTPSQPQHISREIYKVAPSVEIDILSQFNTSLISAGTSAQHVLDFINAMGDKAAAIGDAGAKALGNGMAGLMNGLGAGLDWATAFAGSGLAAATNQAASMVPLRQIPAGIRDPNRSNGGVTSFLSSGMRSDWPNQPTGGGLGAFIGNAVKLGQDLFNAVGCQCLLGAALDSLSRAASLVAQGLGLPALGMQLDGMLRMGLLNPFNMDGLNQLLHGWRFDCGLKHNPPPAIVKPARVKEALKKASNCPTGAMPGNLLYAAYGDDPAPADMVSRAPVAIAARVGSPYTSEIAKFVSDPDSRYDGMADALPSYYQAADPRLAALLKALLAFQEVVEFIKSLLIIEVKDLEKNETQVGGSLVDFVQTIRAQAGRLGDSKKIAVNFTNNRMTNEQQALLAQLGGLWDGLVVDLTVINNANRRDVVRRITEPRDVLGGERLADLVANAPDALDNFGGHVGPELAYAASNQAIMTRSLLLIEKGDPQRETETVNRIAQMAAVATQHAEEVTYGDAQNDYMKALASIDTGLAADMVVVGMPAAVAATKKQVGHQQQTMAAATEMLAQARGSTTVGVGESANDIDHVKENNDTQAYLSGAIQHQHETIKKILTKSVPSVGGSAKLIKDAGISTKPDARAAHVERLIKETSNALASTTLVKTTGVKLDQQSEGRVQQSKFTLMQAGSSIAFESPFIRTSARVLIQQGLMVMTEAESYDVRARWEHHLVEESIGFMTEDFYVTAKGQLTHAVKKAKYHGQEGTEIADLEEVVIDVGQGQAQIRVQGNQLLIRLGAACIVMNPNGRIDLNPSSKPSPKPVTVQYTEAPSMETTPDKAAAVLPTKGARNPVPCAAPYAKPVDVLSALG